MSLITTLLRLVGVGLFLSATSLGAQHSAFTYLMAVVCLGLAQLLKNTELSD